MHLESFGRDKRHFEDATLLMGKHRLLSCLITCLFLTLPMQMHGQCFKFFAFSEEAVGDEGKKIEAVQSNLSQLMANTDNKMHQLEEVFEPKAVRVDR